MSYSNAVALQMPSSYVPMSTEEMEYLEGGYYLSKKECQNLCALACINPTSIALAAVGISVATKAVKAVSSSIGGFLGYAAGALLGLAISYVTTQMLTFGRGVIAGARYNGVDFGFSVSFKDDCYGVTYQAR